MSLRAGCNLSLAVSNVFLLKSAGRETNETRTRRQTRGQHKTIPNKYTPSKFHNMSSVEAFVFHYLPNSLTFAFLLPDHWPTPLDTPTINLPAWIIRSCNSLMPGLMTIEGIMSIAFTSKTELSPK